MFIRFLFTSLVIVLFVHQSAIAADGVLEQRIQVEDRSEATREEALDSAILKVIRARTGTIGQLPDKLKSLQKNKADYIDNYAYERAPDGSIYLDVLFSNRLLSADLRKLGAVIMPLKKPKVLVLLAVSRSGSNSKELVSDDGSKEAQAVIQAFSDYGFEVEFPQWGLRDLTILDQTAVWQQDMDLAHQLAEAYGNNCFVVGAGYQDSIERWRGSWESSCNQEQKKTPVSTASLENFVAFSRNLLVNQVKRRDGVDLSSKIQTFVMKVHQVHSYQSFHDLRAYLSSLQQVASVEAGSLDSASITFKVSIFDEPNKLLSRFQLDGKLEYSNMGEFVWAESLPETLSEDVDA